ncbi:MAG: cation:proton antiporter [Candidatus Woesearchaeota archaeon]|nr:MAG: cation:proton antiporter [Candidatus Woesearchaeota archaeon]
MDLSQSAIILLGLAMIILFGKFAEFIFKRFFIPDTILLVCLGVGIGPIGIGWVTGLSPLIISSFTTFALLFLLFDGALEIKLSSIVKDLGHGLSLTLINFIVSVALITGIMWVFHYPIILSLLVGFMLGGISSSFVIPLLKQLTVSEKTYSQLTLESALTDMLCIVSALSVINLITLNTLSTKQAAIDLMVSFSVAFFVGIVMALIWVFIETKVLQNAGEYMLTIAVLIITAIITEFFGGNGAISALFFGIILKNSKNITNFFLGVTSKQESVKQQAIKGELGKNALSPSEQVFYDQISFFLKTVFFVYIGTLLSFSDPMSILIGVGIVALLLIGRLISSFVTRGQKPFDRKIISAMVGRGLAAAALVQTAVAANVPGIASVTEIIYFVIVASILASSLKVFFVMWQAKHHPELTSGEQ